MTKQERAKKALRKWQERLGLGRWRIVLELVDASELGEDKDNPALGDIDRDYASLDAKIRVAAKLPNDEIDTTICHECLHCLATELREAGNKCASRLSADAQGLAQAALYDAEERLVQTLERAFIGGQS